MKQFFKYVLATMLGMFAFGLILGIFSIISLVSSLVFASGKTNIADNSVFVLKLDGTVEERVDENPLAQLFGDALGQQIGLDEILSAIQKAKQEDNIKGIFIEAGSFSADSYASAQAIRKALADFKKSGKWILSYADNYSQMAYYISSVADEIMLNPQGELTWCGLGGYQMFLKDLLEKFGIKMQLVKVGTYKSAPESYMADKMSDANRKQTEAYLNSIWNNILKDVSENRQIAIEKLNKYADDYTTFYEPKTLVERKLIDKLVYSNEAKAEVKKRLGINDGEESIASLFEGGINQVTIADLKAINDDDEGEEIAVYYAFGGIVQTSTESALFSEGHQIVAQDVCKDLERLAKDENIKAVVLRINSGGGSAYASEQLWHAVEMLKKEKPVVVSMGGMAASGGYYMSCNSNWIVAEPTTITGSIGIFCMFPDLSGLFTEKLGIKFDEVKTNANTTLGAMQVRPMNATELAMVEKYVQRGYNLFLKRVANGRKMTTAQVDAIAQGHVYTAEDAIKIKLVDELGGLTEATKKAANLAKIKTYHTNSYPTPADWITQLFSSELGQRNGILDDKMRHELGEMYEPIKFVKSLRNQDRIQARMPFLLNIN